MSTRIATVSGEGLTVGPLDELDLQANGIRWLHVSEVGGKVVRGKRVAAITFIPWTQVERIDWTYTDIAVDYDLVIEADGTEHFEVSR